MLSGLETAHPPIHVFPEREEGEDGPPLGGDHPRRNFLENPPLGNFLGNPTPTTPTTTPEGTSVHNGIPAERSNPSTEVLVSSSKGGDPPRQIFSGKPTLGNFLEKTPLTTPVTTPEDDSYGNYSPTNHSYSQPLPKTNTRDTDSTPKKLSKSTESLNSLNTPKNKNPEGEKKYSPDLRKGDQLIPLDKTVEVFYLSQPTPSNPKLPSKSTQQPKTTNQPNNKTTTINNQINKQVKTSDPKTKKTTPITTHNLTNQTTDQTMDTTSDNITSHNKRQRPTDPTPSNQIPSRTNSPTKRHYTKPPLKSQPSVKTFFGKHPIVVNNPYQGLVSESVPNSPTLTSSTDPTFLNLESDLRPSQLPSELSSVFSKTVESSTQQTTG